MATAIVVGCALFPASAALAQAPAAMVRGLPDFTDLVEQVGPSVVNIRTLEKARPSSPGAGGPDEEMQELFRRFFGVPMPNAPRQGPRQNRPEQEAQPRGVGSGFILSADGFIMTNAHVVEGADEVMVTLTDKREFKARIVGADKRTDVAVVKIQATGLPAVKVGDVGRLRVGEWVMAIGSPFGLESTVTAGIVSAKQRDTGDYLSFIQTDVAINPGNSGGALVNAQGQIIGVNSAIATLSSGGTSGSIGLGFAIPITEARRVIEEIITSPTNTSTRPVLGVFFDNTFQGNGARILRLSAGEAAEVAGIPVGSIVKSIGGQRVTDQVSAIVRIRSFAPGATVSVTVELPNNGGVKTFTVKLGKAPSNG